MISYVCVLWPRSLDGKKRILFIKAKDASTTIPTMRNGIDNTQITGHMISTIIAAGQQITNSKAQIVRPSNTFIFAILA
ncbi:MAG: hypothetical protein SVY53_12920 [Chloroflexota bacterium]|nr:hypothetical protein [Chloroflexota bacterium]